MCNCGQSVGKSRRTFHRPSLPLLADHPRRDGIGSDPLFRRHGTVQQLVVAGGADAEFVADRGLFSGRVAGVGAFEFDQVGGGAWGYPAPDRPVTTPTSTTPDAPKELRTDEHTHD